MIWSSLPAVPEPLGYSGALAGVSGGALIVAGGTNFPDRPPWHDGTKTWYDRIYVLENPLGYWRDVDERLPRRLGYGVSLTVDDSVICIGGSDAKQHHTDVFKLTWHDGKMTRTDLPPLPRPIANACGAALDHTIYIAGGLAEPNATSTLHTFLALDLAAAKPAWRPIEAWPGPARMLAVAAAHNGAFYLFSGADLSAGPDGKPVRTYLKDAYRYTPTTGWSRLADLPRPAVAAPSPAAIFAPSKIAVFSGDDGSKVNFQPLDKHPGFPHSALIFDVKTNQWTERGDWPLPSVTTPLVHWASGWVVPGGEIRPGVRTPQVRLMKP